MENKNELDVDPEETGPDPFSLETFCLCNGSTPTTEREPLGLGPAVIAKLMQKHQSDSPQ